MPPRGIPILPLRALVRRERAAAGAGGPGRPHGRGRALRPSRGGAPGGSSWACPGSCSRRPARTPWSWRCWRWGSVRGRRSSAPRSRSCPPPTPSFAWAPRPVLADIEETALGLDPADAERRLIAADGGAPARALRGLRRAHGRPAGPGPAPRPAGRGGRGPGAGRLVPRPPLGTLGDAGCFSFHETKNVTCGEGGALALRDRDGGGARGDHPREGHQPRRLPARRGGQVHVGGGGQQLRAVGRAGGDPRRPARQAGAHPGAAGADRGALPARGCCAGRRPKACGCPRSPPDRPHQQPHLPPDLPLRAGAGRLPERAARRGHHGHLPLRARCTRRRSGARCPAPAAPSP